MTEATTVPVRDAATVMLLRDEPRLQVLMLHRNPDAAFAANAHVFPGGAVDSHDHLEHPVLVGTGRDGGAGDGAPGSDEGRPFRVAAVRETFEECGVLLARARAGAAPVALDAPAPPPSSSPSSSPPPSRSSSERFARHRAAVDDGRRTLAEVLAEEDLALDLPALRYVSRWVTPEGAPRRYDTRFYVAHAPAGQEPTPDAREAVASEWVEPREMLRRWARDEVELVLPTVSSLELLAAHRTAGGVLAHADRVESGESAPSGEPSRG